MWNACSTSDFCIQLKHATMRATEAPSSGKHQREAWPLETLKLAWAYPSNPNRGSFKHKTTFHAWRLFYNPVSSYQPFVISRFSLTCLFFENLVSIFDVANCFDLGSLSWVIAQTAWNVMVRSSPCNHEPLAKTGGCISSCFAWRMSCGLLSGEPVQRSLNIFRNIFFFWLKYITSISRYFAISRSEIIWKTEDCYNSILRTALTSKESAVFICWKKQASRQVGFLKRNWTNIQGQN